LAAEAVALEIARHIPPLAAKRGLDSALMFAALGVMPVEWKASAEYEDRREQAEERIAARDPDDWHGQTKRQRKRDGRWSQDKDLTDAGIKVFTTGALLDALAHAGDEG
jgi:hypothetical protein